MSTRQAIVTALDAKLKTISVANGYQTDLGSNVEAWIFRELGKDEPFFLTYRDTSNVKTTQGVEIGRREHNLTIEIEALVADGTSDTTARSLLADLAKCIGVDPLWGGLARWTDIPGDELVVDKRTKAVAAVKMTLTINYRTALWAV